MIGEGQKYNLLINLSPPSFPMKHIKYLFQYPFSGGQHGDPHRWPIWDAFKIRVESRCDAVALGFAYLCPPLSFGGASLAEPSLRFHIPLIEPDVRY